MKFNYALKQRRERVGALELEVQCIEDLNRTIDELFGHLGDSQDTELLESLCPYFGVIWPSARALAGLLERERTALAGARVLEVGCGLALPSLVAAKLGAQVTATDFHPDVPEFLKLNLELNALQSRVNYVRMNWQQDTLEPAGFDWVIGSDILYERKHPEPVASALRRHIRPGGRVIVADPARSYLQLFADEMKRQGFSYRSEIVTVPDDPVAKDVFLLEFVQKD